MRLRRRRGSGIPGPTPRLGYSSKDLVVLPKRKGRLRKRKSSDNLQAVACEDCTLKPSANDSNVNSNIIPGQRGRLPKMSTVSETSPSQNATVPENVNPNVSTRSRVIPRSKRGRPRTTQSTKETSSDLWSNKAINIKKGEVTKSSIVTPKSRGRPLKIKPRKKPPDLELESQKNSDKVPSKNNSTIFLNKRGRPCKMSSSNKYLSNPKYAMLAPPAKDTLIIPKKRGRPSKTQWNKDSTSSTETDVPKNVDSGLSITASVMANKRGQPHRIEPSKKLSSDAEPKVPIVFAKNSMMIPKKRGRPSETQSNDDCTSGTESDVPTNINPSLSIKDSVVLMMRGRPRKFVSTNTQLDIATVSTKDSLVFPKKRGRPSKIQSYDDSTSHTESDMPTNIHPGLLVKDSIVRNRRGQPRKIEPGKKFLSDAEPDVSTVVAKNSIKTLRKRGRPGKIQLNEKFTSGTDFDMPENINPKLSASDSVLTKNNGQIEPSKKDLIDTQPAIPTPFAEGSVIITKERGRPRKVQSSQGSSSVAEPDIPTNMGPKLSVNNSALISKRGQQKKVQSNRESSFEGKPCLPKIIVPKLSLEDLVVKNIPKNLERTVSTSDDVLTKERVLQCEARSAEEFSTDPELPKNAEPRPSGSGQVMTRKRGCPHKIMFIKKSMSDAEPNLHKKIEPNLSAKVNPLKKKRGRPCKVESNAVYSSDPGDVLMKTGLTLSTKNAGILSNRGEQPGKTKPKSESSCDTEPDVPMNSDQNLSRDSSVGHPKKTGRPCKVKSNAMYSSDSDGDVLMNWGLTLSKKDAVVLLNGREQPGKTKPKSESSCDTEPDMSMTSDQNLCRNSSVGHPKKRGRPCKVKSNAAYSSDSDGDVLMDGRATPYAKDAAALFNRREQPGKNNEPSCDTESEIPTNGDQSLSKNGSVGRPKKRGRPHKVESDKVLPSRANLSAKHSAQTSKRGRPCHMAYIKSNDEHFSDPQPVSPIKDSHEDLLSIQKNSKSKGLAISSDNDLGTSLSRRRRSHAMMSKVVDHKIQNTSNNAFITNEESTLLNERTSFPERLSNSRKDESKLNCGSNSMSENPTSTGLFYSEKQSGTGLRSWLRSAKGGNKESSAVLKDTNIHSQMQITNTKTPVSRKVRPFFKESESSTPCSSHQEDDAEYMFGFEKLVESSSSFTDCISPITRKSNRIPTKVDKISESPKPWGSFFDRNTPKRTNRKPVFKKALKKLESKGSTNTNDIVLFDVAPIEPCPDRTDLFDHKSQSPIKPKSCQMISSDAEDENESPDRPKKTRFKKFNIQEALPWQDILDHELVIESA